MSFYDHLIEATATERAQLLAAPAINVCLQGQVSLAT
ncbi:MAG: biliverdin-producing heme oxygenase, partial [Burkholderiaceae bacterium]|nr:biliverdin-producing heme oxygenase [Burkholderiaceae bacterium]